VKISYDRSKRRNTLAARGLDFEDAATVFAGLTLTLPDERNDTARIGIRPMACCADA
jgi:uncharacterized protein